jgi:hypothetical protein
MSIIDVYTRKIIHSPGHIYTGDEHIHLNPGKPDDNLILPKVLPENIESHLITCLFRIKSEPSEYSKVIVLLVGILNDYRIPLVVHKNTITNNERLWSESLLWSVLMAYIKQISTLKLPSGLHERAAGGMYNSHG